MDDNTPSKRAVRVLNNEINKLQDQISIFQFVLGVLKDPTYDDRYPDGKVLPKVESSALVTENLALRQTLAKVELALSRDSDTYWALRILTEYRVSSTGSGHVGVGI